ncbi:hypothetical protein SAMN05444673_6705 [Bacillus sp. OV166]|uniref:hypothetical protein n=1 Tax=Bacillus sp. OV166 TaxID=1882763 RepID=UPI000A2AAFA7|nr:hypothetical protein [Bacillus sp. OV166]SMQ86703.1 hypothetical protein SAMN05444673_6705 [Bacillus sp. OV166]
MKQLNGKRLQFKHVEGKIILVGEHLLWGEWVTSFETEVTEEVIPVVDDYLVFNVQAPQNRALSLR